jgi:hypothetical protein
MIGHRTVLALLVVGGYAAAVRPRLLRWRASAEEVRSAYPGDDLITDASGQTTMATILPTPPHQVWPWLVQMGCNRGGWYSWDRFDNSGRPSADQIMPEWQVLAGGDRLDSVPSGATWFTVAVVDPPWTLVLRADLELPSGKAFDPVGPLPRAYTEAIWGFHLRALPDGRTRLVVRTRVRGRPALAERVADFLLGEPAHFIMQTRQFQNLRRCVSTADDRSRQDATSSPAQTPAG